ncbi:hypothetical protein [Lysinibacillus sp. G01H]|uniref:hypothetical protein n=1 Tax=Lysinibacillus sp. G01H TaxID=3026425 RepID=UPI00237D6FB3|nr:hypothetical protein [Lysinibacillus sp. G01H]WDU78689.1 hypothetical protein PSR12_18875 [Lysinibacillus sp. G01H]
MVKIIFKKKKKELLQENFVPEVRSLTTKIAAERQWKRFNDSDFQHEEFEHRFEKVLLIDNY